MSPRPSTAEPSETTATVFFLIVKSKAFWRSRVDLLADPGDAGRVGHREVVARLQRVLVVLLDLAAAVHRHRAVDVVEDAGAAGRADRAQDLLPVGLVAGVDRELAHPLALGAGAGHEVDALERAAGLGDLRGQLAQRLLARVELDAHGDRELGGDGCHGRRIHTSASESPARDGLSRITPHKIDGWPKRGRQRQGPGELFLIDGNSLAYRAFFALPESIATADGRPTNAIYGFASMMAKLLIDHSPEGGDRRLGHRAGRAARRSTPSTRRSASRAPTCCRSSGRTWRRWPRRSGSPTSRSRATRPTT